jgi:Glycine transporter
MASSAPWVLSQVQVLAEAAATIAFALSGVIEGARKRLDAVGICVVGGLAAFGGGTVLRVREFVQRPDAGLTPPGPSRRCWFP